MSQEFAQRLERMHQRIEAMHYGLTTRKAIVDEHEAGTWDGMLEDLRREVEMGVRVPLPPPSGLVRKRVKVDDDGRTVEYWSSVGPARVDRPRPVPVDPNDVGGLAEKHLRRWFYLGALTVALTILVVVMGPCKAGAATWEPLRYVNQGASVGPLEGQRWAAPGPWVACQLYGWPSATAGPPQLAAAGDTGVAWVSVSEAASMWRKGGWAFRIRVAGQPWSNLALLAVGVPDTFFRDVTGSRWIDPPGTAPGSGWSQGSRRSSPNPLKPYIWEARWIRAEGDTVLVGPRAPQLGGLGPVVHEEHVQLAFRCELCTTYGAVALRGVLNAAVCDTARCP